VEEAVQVFPALLFVREYGYHFLLYEKAREINPRRSADRRLIVNAAAGDFGCGRSVRGDAEAAERRGSASASSEPDICRWIDNRLSGVWLFLRRPDAVGYFGNGQRSRLVTYLSQLMLVTRAGRREPRVRFWLLFEK